MTKTAGRMTSMQGAQALISSLEAAGVKNIYGIIGTSNIAFVDALYDKRNDIRYISTRHEQVAASMADTEGRLTGKPGVCLVHSGPGALNTMISAANAYKDCSPLIIISGAVKPSLRGTDGMLEVDHCRIFEPVCKAVFRVNSVKEFPAIFSSAYRIAMTPAKGPVLIEAPDSLWQAEEDVDLDLDIVPPAPPDVRDEDLQKIFRLFQKADRPLFLAGAGASEAGAATNLQRLAERAHVRVVTTGNGRGVLSEKHPLCLGRAGFFGNPVADAAMEQADLILALGCGLSDLTTYEYTADWRGDLVVINADPRGLSTLPSSFKVNLTSVTADAGDFLHKLGRLYDAKPFVKSNDWMDSLFPIKEQWDAQLAAAASSDKIPLSPGRVLKVFSDLAPENALFACGAGLNMVYVCDFIQIQSPRSYIAPNNFGAMGFGFPAALAAKIVYPDRPVLSVLGDGDFMMTVQDVETAVREKIAATILILNDNCYRALRYTQQILYGARFYGSEYENPDFVKLAESFGAAGFIIKEPSQIEPVLRQAMNCGKLSIVDARIDVDDAVPTNMQAILKMRGLA
ncbi:MAG: thiamine pyrophosphate-binding protein [Candidatus Abyssobacteria bacterium SURF_5]|uniref:Thiamine pyrophosphate-binding protein n=1 Tax=Abyssobacteria bacterium (strain SURF_5) TaxID=2093360 RepID=A0A3A4P0W3_ABYX5|nr:MAG: thiamine pyrophosphate-binding protein [Candidatus Abyssubacteria bacterium SURF_5]